MKKRLFILPILAMLLFASCELFKFEPYIIRQYNYFVLDNKTDNDIVCLLTSLVDSEKSIYTLGRGIDSVAISYRCDYIETCTDAACMTFSLSNISSYNIVLCNLSDTTSYIFNISDFLNTSYGEDEDTIIFRDKICDYSNKTKEDDEYLCTSMLILSVDESLIQILTKDTTMLEEFEDYYTQE